MPREYNMENHHIEMPQQEGASNSTSGLNPPIDASVESVLDIQSIPVVRAQLLVIEGMTTKERSKYPVIWITLFVLILAGVIAGTLAPLLKRCCDSTNAPSHTPTLALSKDPPYPPCPGHYSRSRAFHRNSESNQCQSHSFHICNRQD